jgi:hypothetical protein
MSTRVRVKRALDAGRSGQILVVIGEGRACAEVIRRLPRRE